VGGTLSTHRADGKYIVLVRKSEEKKLFGKPMRSCKDNIKTYLKEMRCDGMDCIHVKQKCSKRIYNAIVCVYICRK
jgi:hypothetical protein